MLTLILQKIIHKKWLVFCLLIGNILLVAVAASYPMYRTSSFQRMLTDEFDAYLESTDTWPAMVTITHNRSRNRESYDYDTIMAYVDNVNNKFNVPIYREIKLLSTAIVDTSPVVQRDEKVSRQVRISAMTQLEEHVSLYVGRVPQPGLVDGEYIEVMVGENVADSMNMLLDEVYEFKDLTFMNGKPLRVKIVGMFRANNENDPYWV